MASKITAKTRALKRSKNAKPAVAGGTKAKSRKLSTSVKAAPKAVGKKQSVRAVASTDGLAVAADRLIGAVRSPSKNVMQEALTAPAPLQIWMQAVGDMQRTWISAMTWWMPKPPNGR